MSDELLRVYLDPAEIGPDDYPLAWRYTYNGQAPRLDAITPDHVDVGVKDLIREQAGYRCERCGHPYPPGITETCPRGEWTPCDEMCTHGGQVGKTLRLEPPSREGVWQAQWRILTTHHLNGVKHDCRWWNLAALCQRCHLLIQNKVVMEQLYPHEHTDWFKPHAAGYYASVYLGLDLTRDETLARLDELLALERAVEAATHDR